MAHAPDSEPVSPDHPRAISVFCVDDHAAFREVLSELIAATPGLTQVGEAVCGEEAIAAVAKLRPDLVLMDVCMPGIDGFEATRILVESRRDLVVVLMSADCADRPPGYFPRGGEIVTVAKEDLCPRMLLNLWHGRRTRSEGAHVVRGSTDHAGRVSSD